MKYDAEYKETTSREEFVKLVLKRYITTKSNAIKRYYEARKRNIKKYTNEEKQKPNSLKMFTFEDMKKYGKLNRERLYRYGFTVPEVNWLEDEGKL
jgi:hypothetical protein